MRKDTYKLVFLDSFQTFYAIDLLFTFSWRFFYHNWFKKNVLCWGSESIYYKYSVHSIVMTLNYH